MGLFGSRDEDPLLQDDPFAPNSDESDGSDEGGSPESASSAQRRREEPGRAETRAITCTQAEATEGALADLNQALVQNWRLARIQVRDDGRLVFQLRRDQGASGEAETII